MMGASWAFWALSSVGTLVTVVRDRTRKRRHYLAMKKQIEQEIQEMEDPEMVVVPRPQEYDEKVKHIIAGGLEKLQIIADFDRTISSFYGPDGKRGVSCHGIVESYPKLSQRYHDGVRELFETYFPIETSSQYTVEEKIPLMEKWYRGNHEMLLQENFNRHDVHKAVKGSNIQLRGGAGTLFELVERYNIPLLIFSAGLGNILKEVITQRYGRLGQQTHIVSNWMLFDRNGDLTGFTEPLIHMFNKDDRHIRGTSYYARLKERQHIILLGDGMGDVDMARDEDHDLVLRVGFLNQQEDELLPQFCEKYDLVILHDGPMTPVLELIWKILHGG